MDENALEISIKQYKQQLQQIESLLNQNQDCEDLISLKNDLLEVIKTTEESLLCVKKSNLLKLLEESEGHDVEETNDVSGNAEQQSNLLQFKEIEDAISGTQCQAPYTFSWGVTGFYNAMILNIACYDEETEQLQVRVLFTNPTHQSMLPCPYFLEGKCRFNDNQCKFSHGCVVSMNELKEYKEPDFSLLKVNDKCLAKYEDDIWYKATILSFTSETVKIHYDTYNVDKTLNLEEVLPTNASEDVSNDELSDDDNVEDHVIAEFYENKNVENTGVLGDWERHTKGIASKLMAKMGYIVGQGLGKYSDGRVDPVKIILLPTGKSLDACAELREKNMLKEPFKKRKPKPRGTQVSKTDVFEFINNTLGGKKGDIHHINHREKVEAVHKKTAKPKTQREYNVELCKLEQERNKLQKEVKKQKNSFSRNEKDSRVAGQAKQRLDNLYNEIKRIENQERLVKQKIDQNNEHKKLTVF